MAKNIWEAKKRISFIKIGVFFLIGTLLLLFTLISIKDVTLFKPVQEIRVMFDFAEGLKRASPVRFCGVDIGKVSQVKVVSGPDGSRVLVEAAIDRRVKIPKDSRFFINSLSLFGEKYLEITPPAEFSGYIKDKEIIEGVSPVPLFKVVAGITETMEDLRSFIEEEEIKGTLERTAKNLESITFETRGLILDIKAKKGTVGRLLYDDSLYQITEEFISDIKRHPWKLLHKPREERR